MADEQEFAPGIQLGWRCGGNGIGWGVSDKNRSPGYELWCFCVERNIRDLGQERSIPDPTEEDRNFDARIFHMHE